MNPTTKLVIILLTLALLVQPLTIQTEAKGDVEVLEDEDIYVGECIILGKEHYIQLTEITGRETVWSYYKGRPEGYGYGYGYGYQPTEPGAYGTQRRIREDKDGTFSIERVDVTIEVEEVEYGFMGVGGYGVSEGGSASINLVIEREEVDLDDERLTMGEDTEGESDADRDVTWRVELKKVDETAGTVTLEIGYEGDEEKDDTTVTINAPATLPGTASEYFKVAGVDKAGEIKVGFPAKPWEGKEFEIELEGAPWVGDEVEVGPCGEIPIGGGQLIFNKQVTLGPDDRVIVTGDNQSYEIRATASSFFQAWITIKQTQPRPDITPQQRMAGRGVAVYSKNRMVKVVPDLIDTANQTVTISIYTPPGWQATLQTGEVTPEGTPDLKIDMAVASPDKLKVGERANVTIHVKNDGDGDAKDVRIDTTIPLYLVASGRTSDTRETLKAGEMMELTFEVLANKPGTENIKVTVTGKDVKGNKLDVRTKSIPIEAKATKPKITVTKNVSPATITVGQSARVVVTVKNDGDGAAENVVITDTPPMGLTVIGQTTKTIPELPPQGTQTLQYTVEAIEVGQFTLEAAQVSYTTEQGETGTAYSDPVTLQVSGVPRLEATVLVDRKEIGVEEVATLTITIVNTGNADATNRQITFTPSPGLVVLNPDGSESGSFSETVTIPQGGQQTIAIQVRGKEQMEGVPIGTLNIQDVVAPPTMPTITVSGAMGNWLLIALVVVLVIIILVVAVFASRAREAPPTRPPAPPAMMPPRPGAPRPPLAPARPRARPLPPPRPGVPPRRALGAPPAAPPLGPRPGVPSRPGAEMPRPTPVPRPPPGRSTVPRRRTPA